MSILRKKLSEEYNKDHIIKSRHFKNGSWVAVAFNLCTFGLSVALDYQECQEVFQVLIGFAYLSVGMSLPQRRRIQ